MSSDDPTLRLVARMRRESFSRNRHCAAFAEPAAQRARRVARHLRSLERALAVAEAEVAIDEGPSGVRIRVTRPSLHLRHDAFLSRDELALLCENPAVRARIGQPAAEGVVRPPR